MEINTRSSTLADRPQLVQFWGEHSGWGEMDENTWDSNFGRTPYGPSVRVLAEIKESGELIGQFIFLPMPVVIAGREALAYRAFAPIVKSDLRLRDDSFSLQGVILQMYLYAAEHLSQAGAELIYSIPDPRWARLFAMAPFFAMSTFPLMNRPLALSTDAPDAQETKVGALSFHDARIDDLWVQNQNRYDCLALRNQVFLNWKNSHRAYELSGVWGAKNELIGAFVSIRKIQQKQALICDVLCSAKPKAFAQTIRAAVQFLQEQESRLSVDEPRLEKIAILAIPGMVPTLETLGFAPDQYRFHLVVHALHPGLDPASIAPERWYISAND
jgi:hypothetical protein